ncbi:hypothetical protein GCM10027028_07750 [Streptomyces sundarbansensis]
MSGGLRPAARPDRARRVRGHRARGVRGHRARGVRPHPRGGTDTTAERGLPGKPREAAGRAALPRPDSSVMDMKDGNKCPLWPVARK